MKELKKTVGTTITIIVEIIFIDPNLFDVKNLLNGKEVKIIKKGRNIRVTYKPRAKKKEKKKTLDSKKIRM